MHAWNRSKLFFWLNQNHCEAPLRACRGKNSRDAEEMHSKHEVENMNAGKKGWYYETKNQWKHADFR